MPYQLPTCVHAHLNAAHTPSAAAATFEYCGRPSCLPLCPLCSHAPTRPAARPQLTVRQLLPWARDNLLKDRPELFMKGESV